MYRKEKPSPNSTHVMLNQLVLNRDVNEHLINCTRKLYEVIEDEEVFRLKQQILELIKKHKASLLTRLYGSTTVLQQLIDYYRYNDTKDELYELLITHQKGHEFLKACDAIFKLADEHKINVSYYFITTKKPNENDVPLFSIEVRIECKTLAEATLAACVLETVLYESFGIPFRSARKSLPISFTVLEVLTKISMDYILDDFLKITQLQLNLNDKLLKQTFSHPKADFYDYFQQKYGIENTRAWLVRNESQTTSVEKLTTEPASHHQEIDREHFFARLLIITRTGLGSGNYMNARGTIEGLCKKMPQVHIYWIIATDGDPLPQTAALPQQIKCYVTDDLWKLYPLIRSLSLNADLVASLPNAFLIYLEKNLNTHVTLSRESIFVVVGEYNVNHEDIPPYYHLLTSGVNAGPNSLGLIHPQSLMIPTAIEEKRALLCQDEKASLLFIGTPDAPLYFAYAYHPNKHVVDDIQGLRTIDILALFIQHAKKAAHKNIKIVLPIDKETIERAIQKFPQIFDGCFLTYVTSNNIDFLDNGRSLFVEVLNLFPFNNTTFRLLMDYAAAHDTPVVVTGDQSFMELFFTMSSGFMFIYQLLEHKKELLNEIKLIAQQKYLTHLIDLIALTATGLLSEAQIINLVTFLQENKEQLKQESQIVAATVQSQPDLVESLTRFITEHVAPNNCLLEIGDEPFSKSFN